ncbi:four helix bundle protein [Schinkia azotoformans]|nr:four helix bundle protein [Schinkia azotoformans]MEC1767501.1 four helix bundle protein [Schinkia azotoformans]MEC1788593.1 four helix bundle protein [Schinkia azotoformans]
MWVQDFRKNALYQRSLDLAHEVYRTVEIDGENIGEKEAIQLRKRAVRITKKITHAIVQQNIKMKFKSLNEAKLELEMLLKQVYKLYDKKRIDEFSGFNIDCCANQVMKLLNFYFGVYREKRI